MNSFNALGFLALGSMMNALPAVAPSLVERGGAVIADLTPSALWLHLMGVVVGVIGSSTLVKDLFAMRSRMPVPAVRPVAAPRHAPVPAGVAQSA